ncbi:MAG: ABC transporter permease [Bacteroidaceae bacterium]|nr:ABC transporter permease [Bacteroidaceae bacterium]
MLWKLLRKHISVAQLVGFVLANLVGMLIVLTSIQFYRDVEPVFSGKDKYLADNYLVVSKKIGYIGGFLPVNTDFSAETVEELAESPFVEAVGKFTQGHYDVRATVGLFGDNGISTDMFFEAVPDEFVDIPLDNWHFDANDSSQVVPIVLPRNYLAMYNFGFAQSRNLPKMSEEMIGKIAIRLRLQGALGERQLTGRVIGFGKRLNTVLVPQAFIDWSNQTLAGKTEFAPTRLIIKVANTADDRITQFMDEKGYEVEDDKTEAGRVTFLLRVASAIVISIGLIISALSFFILMLSIYLLVQKNTTKLQNLLLIGYPTWRVALPYQLLSVGVNLIVLVLALLGMYVVRSLYMNPLTTMFPDMEEASVWLTMVVGILLFIAVSWLNATIIRRKIKSLF